MRIVGAGFTSLLSSCANRKPSVPASSASSRTNRNGFSFDSRKALRARLGLTQEQFALKFNLPLQTVQHWEQGRELDQASNNYLRVIMSNPAVASQAQEQPVEA